MRILRVAQKVYPEVPGGGTYHVHAMSRDQAAMGHDVTVLTVDREGERPHTEARDGYRVIRYPVSASVLGNDISAGVASYLRAVGDYDVLHAHSHLYFSTNLAALRRATGGPPLALTPDGPTSELIDHDGPVVLYVGRLVEGKRPQDAIRAVSQLSDELAVKLYVLGNGPMRDELEAMADKSVVEFLGHVPFEEMPAVYRAGDVLLLPSRAEGLPRTVLEAFASGVPVVSSHLEHTAPVVREGGETVEIGDVKGYVRALEQVLDRRAALGASGRETVVEEFRWQDTVERTTAVLESLG